MIERKGEKVEMWYVLIMERKKKKEEEEPQHNRFSKKKCNSSHLDYHEQHKTYPPARVSNAPMMARTTPSITKAIVQPIFSLRFK